MEALSHQLALICPMLSTNDASVCIHNKSLKLIWINPVPLNLMISSSNIQLLQILLLLVLVLLLSTFLRLLNSSLDTKVHLLQAMPSSNNKLPRLKDNSLINRLLLV